ncbi:Hypothetical protein D9617_15g041840 [Elsinoe fawcettii]|nr:Hypothetical protein D9617_15g041840 [Elsinoe fawcettii]
MHLGHKLPWNTAIAQFNILQSEHTPDPPTIALCQKKDRDLKALGHFGRVLAETICDFGKTEAAKFRRDAAEENPPSSSEHDLFSDKVTQAPEQLFGLQPHITNSLASNALSSEQQDLMYWTDRATNSRDSRESPTFSTNDADLADAIKTLITIASVCSLSRDDEQKEIGHEAFQAVVRLARHPELPLRQLDKLHWGHNFGIERLKDVTLRIYLLTHLVQGSGSTTPIHELESFKTWANDGLADYDFPSQNLYHWWFWGRYGISLESIYGSHDRPAALKEIKDPLLSNAEEDMVSLDRYLKTCFGILYRYEVLQSMWHGEQESKAKWIEDIEYVFKGLR